MLKKSFLKFHFFLTCLLPAVSARLLADMFNFGIKEYIPYIVVTAILLFTMFRIHEKLKNVRMIIFMALEIFMVLIFPSIFFYMIEGFSKRTIALISYDRLDSSIIVLATILQLINKYIGNSSNSNDSNYRSSDNQSEKIQTTTNQKLNIVISIAIALIILSFPSVFSYVTEGLSTATIAIISTSCVIIVILILIRLGLSFTVLFTASFLIILSIFIYLIVIFFKTDFDAKFQVTIFVVNLVIGCCFSYFHGTKVGAIIACIMGGIDYYVFFYNLLKEVNPVSLLLFWTALWFILYAVYLIIDGSIPVEPAEDYAPDVQNYF